MNSGTSLAVRVGANCALIALFSARTAFADGTNLEQEISELRAQNAALQQQLQKQNESLETLSKKVEQLETANAQKGNKEIPAPQKGGFNFGNVNLSAEGGVAFFNTGNEGFARNSEFRVDEARLYLEAPIWKEVYFFGEADLATRENDNLNVQLGELYLDFQDVSQLWGHDNQLNFRAGRMNIPFGEEYQTRYAIDNPLISHSLPDIWGFDSGVEIYGSFPKWNYVVAVQNGSGSGANGMQDFNGDKSVAGRIGFDPNRHWHFSLSGMRTGDESPSDFISALWFGNDFFQSLSTNATKFHANLVEGDVTARWDGGHVSGFGGYARYDDNDPAANNGRDIFYYSVEGVQDLPKKFYAVARFSEIFAAKGIPIMGYGNGNYFSKNWTTELWRLSLGLGYRFSDSLIIKTEYSFERGDELNGDKRNHEDFFGTEAAFKF